MNHLARNPSRFLHLGVAGIAMACSIAQAQQDPADAASAAIDRCQKVMTSGPVQKRNPNGVKCFDRATAMLTGLMNQSLEALEKSMKPAQWQRLSASQQKWREFGVDHFAVLDAMAANDPTNTEVQVHVALERFSHVRHRASQLFHIESFPQR